MNQIERTDAEASTFIAVSALADELFGGSLDIVRMQYGHMSETYEVRLSDWTVMLRTNANPHVFATTEHNLRTLKDLGLPVPNIISSDLSRTSYPFAWLATEKIPGRDLGYDLASMSHSQMDEVARQVVGCEKAAGSLPLGSGFGYVGIGETGPMSSWTDFIYHFFDNKLISAPCAADLKSGIETLLKKNDVYFRSIAPMCFLDDLTVKNVIVENAEFKGIVDFDCVCYGDPLWWIGLTAAGVVSDVGPHKLSYVEDLCRHYGIPENQQQIVPLYSAMHALDFIRQSDDQPEGAWMQLMVAQAGRWISDAEK